MVLCDKELLFVEVKSNFGAFLKEDELTNFADYSKQAKPDRVLLAAPGGSYSDEFDAFFTAFRQNLQLSQISAQFLKFVRTISGVQLWFRCSGCI